MLYRRFFKTTADRVLAVVGLALLSPVVGLLAILIRQRLGRPVLFRQVRIGLHDKPFVFLKFRTMTDENDRDGNLLSDDRRVTPFGRFLRGCSLDELPQLWNVIKGEMSLIGPRPLLPAYLPRYSALQRRRHEVKPGITGLAQVKGRNSLTWEEKFDLDVWYVDHLGFKLDLEILSMTLVKVVKREGIRPAEGETAPAFQGSGAKREGPNSSRVY